MRFFQRALVGFNNFWIYFTFRELSCDFMSKIPSPLIPIDSWARGLGSRIFSCFSRNHILFFVIFWNSTNLAMYHSLNKRVWFAIIFYLSKRFPICFRYGFSFYCYTLTYFVILMELSRIELPKLTPSILMEMLIILFLLVDQFYFLKAAPYKAWLFENWRMENRHRLQTPRVRLKGF